MAVKHIGLIWIVVKDINAAVRYYTEVVGLKLTEFHEEFGWAELAGPDGKGAFLGIAQESPQCEIGSGQNAVITLSTNDLDETLAEMVAKGAKCEGEICEVPGHVRMQLIVDPDGNRFQVCQQLTHSCAHC